MKGVWSFCALTWLAVVWACGSGAVAGTPDDRLAIKGYDPVAYFTDSRPMAGDPHFEYEWDGAVYRFASPQHLELFKVDPEHYAPQYGNFCTAALSRGKRVISDPNNWVIQDGRLYLFGSPAGPTLMSRDHVGMKARADANWPRRDELPWGSNTAQSGQQSQ